MTTSNVEKRGPSYQTCAVLIAVVGVCGWVVQGALTGAPVSPASLVTADGGAQAGGPPPIYLSAPPTAPQPIVLMLAPGEEGATPGAVTQGGVQGTAQGGAPGGPQAAAPVAAYPTGAAPSAVYPTGGGGQGWVVTGAGQTPAGGGGAAAPPSSDTVLPGGVPPRTEAGASPQGAVYYVEVTPPGAKDHSSHTAEQSEYQVLASNGAIVHIGRGDMTANTGPAGSSGVVALGVAGSDLVSGRSTVTADTEVSHANGSFQGLLTGANGNRAAAISGFEDHSVSVVGDDQIVTYDDSNVFVNRNGEINANTGDTDSSGLNAAVVHNSRVWAGNSGDSEGDDEDEEEEEEEEEARTAAPDDTEDDGPATVGPQTAAPPDGSTTPTRSTAPAPSSAPTASATRSAGGHATVTDEGASQATGPGALVVGADGFDDVSIRSRGDRNIVTYDDSNVVIGGTGNVNAQIGDSDTGGAVVMGIYDSDVRAGCEGDLCHRD